MEKQLRSSLKSSAEEFILSATKHPLKSSKSALKTLINTISPSSPLSSSLPLALHHSISDSVASFQNLLKHPPPPPPPPPETSQASPDLDKSPPSKRPRRYSCKNPSPQNSRTNESNPDQEKQQILEKLQILTHIVFLCVCQPKKSFSQSDLLPVAQLLHDNLVLFESDSVLLSEIASLCEEYWKEDLVGREMLISQSLPFLVSRSLTLKKKVDMHRVYRLREAFTLFDFEDESIEDLKLLLIRCLIAPLYLKTEEGKKFLAFMFGLNMQLLKEALAMIKSQIPFGRKSILEGYGEILFRAWKGVEGGLKQEIENEFLQVLIEGAIHASSGTLAASVRRVLGGFISQRISDGVEKLLFCLAEPVIFRSLQVANSNVRLNALHLLLDLFPVEDPDATKEAKDTLLDKQFFLLEKLLTDDCPNIRVVAVEGCCRVLHLFWEIIPSSIITKILTKIFDDMSYDINNEVRVSTLNGIAYLLGNPQSHEILKVLLPRLGHLILDNILLVRVAVVDLLLLIRDIRTFQFNKVVGLDVLLSTLANDQSLVAQKITKLLMPSYFPSKVCIEEACNRCVTLIKRSPKAGARFCEFALSEGASLKSLMELVKVLISLVVPHNNLDADQIEGLLVAAASLCINLASETGYKNALRELFARGKIRDLFAAASTGHAKSSVLNMFSAISPDDISELVEECMCLVTNSSGLSESVEMQEQVRSAHKLLLACDGLDDMIEALTKFLQKTAYRCHVKFGTEMPKQRVSPGKRKKCKSSVKVSAKWKHVKGKNASEFAEDYSIAVGIAWQIKDLLASDEARKAILGSHTIELPFLALKFITEVSIVQCVSCEYMDITPVLAYTALALHMTFQNISLSSAINCGNKKNDKAESSTSNFEETVLDQTTNHLLNCVEKQLAAGDVRVSGNLPSSSKEVNAHGKKQRKLQANAYSSCNGSSNTKTKRLSTKVKMLIAIQKFIVDSIAMGFLSHIHGQCLKFTSTYLKDIISALGQQLSEKLKCDEDNFKEIIFCLKSSFSYAAKLLSLILRDITEASSPPPEAFDLANDMLDLISSVELYLGSGFAARIVVAAKSWLPDLVLALGSRLIIKQNQMETELDHVKLHFPSWLSALAKTELCKTTEAGTEEEDRISKTEQFPVFRKFMEMMISLSKGNHSILDAIGVICLIGSIIGLERKDFELVLGLLQLVRVKLVGEDDREWHGLDMMLNCLPEIYPQIERKIEEESNEDVKQKLISARMLLEPVWLYHIYETGRFSEMEE